MEPKHKTECLLCGHQYTKSRKDAWCPNCGCHHGINMSKKKIEEGAVYSTKLRAWYKNDTYRTTAEADTHAP